jgi:hypothetical protein
MSSYFNDKILPIAITISATASLFIIDKVIGFYLKKKELRRTWYMDMIIKPNITLINDYFENIIALTMEYNEYIKNTVGNGATIESHIEKKNFFLAKFKSHKSVIINGLTVLLKDNYKDVYLEIFAVLSNLEDYFSKNIDKLEPICDFDSYINNKKKDFFDLLYVFID